MSKHTPGKWRYEGPDCFSDFNILPPNDTTGALAGVVNNGRPPAEVLANARLIAAAPEMYEALQAWMDHRSARMSSDDYSTIPAGRMDEIIRAAEAALAKATGEPNA
jgi:hypothetical protein